jgi:hypothetical protein
MAEGASTHEWRRKYYSGPSGMRLDSTTSSRISKNAEGLFSPDPFIDKNPTMMRNDHRIVFTDGDFAPRNIMVQWHVVVGLIDWEHSGAYNA